MKPFQFLQPVDTQEALKMLAQAPGGGIIAGGSDLLAELKEGIAHYERLIAISDIEGLGAIRAEGEHLWLGAAVTLHRLENAPELEGGWNFIREAARSVATPEIRNQATLGGNLCQRPRCLHYRSRWVRCWKKGHRQCPALESPFQKYLSIMGGVGCHSAHPSDMAPALMILNAVVAVEGPNGERTGSIPEFFTPHGGNISRENMLLPGELVTGVRLPPAPEGWRGTYLKARERSAGDFAIIAAAVGFVVREGVIRDARVALGGAAVSPIRSPEAEQALEGMAPTPENAAKAAAAAFSKATPLEHNGFKIDLGQALIVRAVADLTE